MIERIDRERLPAARAIVDYAVRRVSEDGLFHPEESLWAESGVYRAQHAGTLAVAGKLLDDERCIEAARHLLYRMLDVRIDKLWGMDWWWDHPLAATGTRRLEATIKPGLDALLAESSRRYEHSLATTPAVESPRRRANTAGVVASDNPNDFRHNASTTDHVNNRANMAVAIMMKHYDLAAGEAVYTDTPLTPTSARG